MVAGVLLYLVLGELLLPAENKTADYICRDFSEGWSQVKADGSKVPIQIPGRCEAKRNELVVMEATLPEYIEDNIYLCIRSFKQEMRIFIDGKLRQVYSTKNTRPVGRVSAVAYVFTELRGEDAGKTVRVETRSDSSYTGIVQSIYCGDRMGIWRYLFEQHGAELIIAFLMLMLSVISIVSSIALRLCYRKRVELEYLGWGIFISSGWIIVNSVFRQVLFPNLSVISDIAFYMIMLMAIPFMLYINGVQKERYEKLYILVNWIAVADFFVCTLLHILNIVDFTDTIVYMAGVAVLSIAVMEITIIVDIVKGKVKEYIMTAAGIIGISIAAIIQIVMYFRRTTPFNGSVIALGMVFILAVSAIHTMQDILQIEKEKQQAILSNEAKGRFLANMSHEIRTPINAVLGMDEMILRESTDSKIIEYASDIKNAGQNLLSIINDILDFSKIESGKMEILPVEYDFSSFIHDVSAMILTRAEEKHLKMHVSVNPTLPYRLFGDEIRIRQVLLNILTNAVKYTEQGGFRLTVDGVTEGENVRLYFSVEDTGIGIKEEDISKLFEKFERIEEKRNRNIEGTGLGLNITMHLLEMMGSTLQVESVYGKGSKFSFELVQKIVDAEPVGDLEDRLRRRQAKLDYKTAFFAPEAAVLIVDDNAMNRKVFKSLLKETKMQMDEAESGWQCLEMVVKKHYDIIFLDDMMPELDGVETLQKMKAFREYPCKDTPVVALTANAVAGAREMYLEEGFDDFISKPVVPAQLEKKIQRMLPEDKVVYEEVEQEEDTALWKNAEDLPAVDGIDWNYGLLHLSDRNLLLDAVKDFYAGLEGRAVELEQCYQDIRSDADALKLFQVRVHAMKSAALLIGAVPLSGMAKALEYAARDGRYEVIDAILPVFLEEWRSYHTKLKVCIPKEVKKPVEDEQEICELLHTVRISMEEMDVDMADEAVKELLQYQYADEEEILMNQLKEAVVNLEQQKAVDLVTVILQQNTDKSIKTIN